MSSTVPQTSRVRFGEFELDLPAGELRRNGTRVPLPEQPLRLLEVLVQQPGRVVSRDQLRERLWSADTFVDFEHGLNAAVKRLRDALGDSADAPRFVETVPKRGYRFIAATEPIAQVVEPPSHSSRWRNTSRRAALIMGAAVILGAAAWLLVVNPQPRDPSPLTPPKLTRLSFEAGVQTDPTFSPDGQTIAYASNESGNFDIWTMPIAGGAATRLTDHPAHDIQPAWSPDGRTILFRSDRDGGGIFAMAPGDRHVTRLTSFGFSPRWSPDGSSFAFTSGLFSSGQAFLAPVGGGPPIEVAQPHEPKAIQRAMGWHPDGRLVWLRGHGEHISLRWRRGGATPVDVPIPVAVRQRFQVQQLGVVDNERLAWSDARTLFFIGAANGVVDLWRLAVAPDSLTILEGPVRVTTGTDIERALAVGTAGQLVFSATSRTVRAWVFDLDVQGHIVPGAARPVTAESVAAAEPALTYDGKRLVVRIDRTGSGRQSELREIDFDTQKERTLRTIDITVDDVRFPRYAPDGLKLSYSYRQFRPGTFRSAVKVLDLRSLEESFVTSPWSDGTVSLENPWGWSHDGATLLVTSTRYRAPLHALVRLPLSAAPRAETRATVMVADPSTNVWQATESPDGRWVAFNQTPSDSVQRSWLFVMPASGGTPKRFAEGASWDDYPRWSFDGRRIYFISTRDGSLNVWSVGFDPDTGSASSVPERVTNFDGIAEAVADNIGSTGLSVGDRRLALLLQRRTGGLWLLE